MVHSRFHFPSEVTNSMFFLEWRICFQCICYEDDLYPAAVTFGVGVSNAYSRQLCACPCAVPRAESLSTAHVGPVMRGKTNLAYPCFTFVFWALHVIFFYPVSYPVSSDSMPHLIPPSLPACLHLSLHLPYLSTRNCLSLSFRPLICRVFLSCDSAKKKKYTGKCISTTCGYEFLHEFSALLASRYGIAHLHQHCFQQDTCDASDLFPAVWGSRNVTFLFT